MNLVKIGDIAKVFNGYAFQSSKYTDSGYRVIRIANVQDGYITNDNQKFIQLNNGLDRFALEEGDLLISLTGNVGRVGRITNDNLPAVLNQRVGKLILNKDKVTPEFLYYFFRNSDTENRLINEGKGIAQKNIGTQDIEGLEVYLPSLDEQEKIVNSLDQADSLRQKRKQAIDLLDEYLKSVFLEMFGDPVTNSMNWDKSPLHDFGDIITGNTPSRAEKNNYSDDYIEWIKTDNIVEGKLYLTPASEYLSEIGLKKARFVISGAVLMACIAGSVESIGRVALADRKVSFNQQINAIQPNEKTNSIYLYWLFRITKSYIQEQATRGMKKILTKGEFEKIEMILPPKELQDKFEQIAFDVDNLKQKMIIQSHEMDNQFNALMQKHFNPN